MSATDKIKSHFNSAIDGAMQKIKVEEWDMDIYCRKTYSFKDEQRIIQLQAEGKIVDSLVESLIIKARDAEGKRIFADADRVTLMHEADPAVVTRVVGQINSAGPRTITPVDAAKESIPTQS
jgi:hypothetical protein